MLRIARPARHEGGLVHQIAVILGVSVLSGVLIAGLALPWIGLAKKGAEQGASAVDGFPLKLTFKPLDERTRVLDSHGNQIASFYDENRKYVKLDHVSQFMQKAIVAIEDDRFYEHGAIDVKGTLRAFLVNQANGGVVQGGSSITQQLVKRTRLENATTAAQVKAITADTTARKFVELRYAVWVEDHLTKDQILEHYLNAAYFGAGAYGIEAAAHRYFGTTASKLNLTQSAMLAGLVRNPTGYDPRLHRKDAVDRRNTVLERLLDLHVITTQQENRAHNAPLGLKIRDVPNGCVNTDAPWFCDYLLNYLLQDDDLGKTLDRRKQLIYGGGLTIKTTLDMRFQRSADNAVSSTVFPQDNAIGGVAMVEPGTGYVRALAQSRPMGPNKNKGQTFLNYVVPTRYGDSNGFQAGSTFKAFVLTQAVKDQIPLNTVIQSPEHLDIPMGEYKVCNDQYYASSDDWSVSNSTLGGADTLYTGTQNSVNTFYAQLEKITGLCGPWHLAKKMGIELPKLNSPEEKQNPTMVPSFTLGIVDVSPLEMAEVYATFAARGKHCDSTPVLEIRDRTGHVIPTAPPKCNRVMTGPEADAVNDILAGVMEPGGFGSGIALNQPSAGKTGTVAPAKSVWFVGYTPNLATAAMVAGANREGSQMNIDYATIGGVNVGGVHGSTTAGPMWYKAMSGVQEWLPDVPFVAPNSDIINGVTVTIPYYTGYNPDTAAADLSRLGFNPQIGATVNSDAPAGTVAYTTPSGAGISGETVTIYISNGIPVAPPPDNNDGDGNNNGGDHNGGGNHNGGDKPHDHNGGGNR